MAFWHCKFIVQYIFSIKKLYMILKCYFKKKYFTCNAYKLVSYENIYM